MAFDSGLLTLMPHTVSYRLKIGNASGYGEPAWGTVATARARVVKKSRLVRSEDGRELVARAIVYLAGDYGLEGTSQIKLPGETEFRQLIRVESYPDASGAFYQQAYTL